MGITEFIFVVAAVTLGRGALAPPAEHPHQTIAIPVTQAHFYTQEASERAMLGDLNAVRIAHGLEALIYDARLSQVARAHAQDMLERSFFGHVTPDGKSPADRLREARISYRSAAENISYQYHGVGIGAPAASDDESSAQQSLYASLPHRENMLNAGFHRVGVGAVSASLYGTAFVQLFSD